MTDTDEGGDAEEHERGDVLTVEEVGESVARQGCRRRVQRSRTDLLSASREGEGRLS
ncbi:MAG: hypothetical protein M3503_00510 [Actinomycetota bacterium]|nr:hypothetical protein [Actinomycetota bacterium]